MYVKCILLLKRINGFTIFMVDIYNLAIIKSDTIQENQ